MTASGRSKNDPSHSRRIVVIGVWNMLLSDEGVGIHVVNKLKNAHLPSSVDVYDCGTNGIAVLEAMDGAEKAIIIDAVSSGKEPGTVLLYTIEDLVKKEDGLLKLVSLHQFDLIATLRLAKLTDAYRMPSKVIIIGVEAKSLECSLKLSAEVRKAIPKVIETITHEIDVLG